MKKYTTEDFIIKAKSVHGNRYDYSKVDYTGSHNDIIITCKVHGDFTRKAYSHLGGHNCPKWGDLDKSKSKLKDVEASIEGANRVHYNKYNYNNINYVGNHVAVKIYCPNHGAFYQTPQCHLKGGVVLFVVALEANKLFGNF